MDGYIDQHVIRIKDSVMQEIMNKYNKDLNTNYALCFSSDYVIARDFNTNKIMSNAQIISLLIKNYTIYNECLYETKKWLYPEQLDNYFIVFRDFARKEYLLFWETTGGEKCCPVLQKK